MSNKPSHKLSLSEVAGYGSGAIGKSLQWNSVNYLFLFYLTDIIGLSPSISGILILLSLFWAGAIDIPLSYIFDKYRHIYGSYQKILLIAAPLSGFSYVLLFYVPPLTSGNQIFNILLTVLLFRTCYSLIDIPHNALLSNLTQDSHERSTLSASRIFFNSGALFVLAIAISPLLERLSDGRIESFRVFSIFVACFFIMNIFLCVYSIRLKNPLNIKRQIRSQSLKHGIGNLLKNKPLLTILGIELLTSALVPAFVKLALFYSETALGSVINSSLLLAALALAQMFSMYIWSRVVKLSDKRNAALFAYAGIILVCISFYIIAPKTPFSVAVFFFIFGIFKGGIQMLIWALLPDTIEYGENISGVRNEALTFGSFQLVVKVGDGISIGLLGFLLGVIGYGSEAENLTHVSEDISLIMFTLPILGALLSMLLLYKYSLTKDKHALLNKRAQRQIKDPVS